MDSNEAGRLIMSGEDGVAEWNRRRAAAQALPLRLTLAAPHDESPLNLRGIDLGGCSLVDSDLSGADLSGAYLFRARLGGVSLFGANLTGATLAEADLAGADLTRANFEHADLREAVLARAHGKARFAHARLDRADLADAKLDDSDFGVASLVDAALPRVSLRGAHLVGADLQGADLRGAQLQSQGSWRTRLDRAHLAGASLAGADLTGVSLVGANLNRTDLEGADLSHAVLEEARLVGTRLSGATLSGCAVYGISAWDLTLDDRTRQRELNIAPDGEASITVDDLEVAQFMYLLMNNARLRRVIDTITSKVVLILGRFTEDRKPVLDALRRALRSGGFDFVPIVFDFDQPLSRTTGETIATLAGMARFVIADLTDAKSVLQELRDIVPDSPSLPVQPLLLDTQDEPGMLDTFRRYPWFLKPFRYADAEGLLARLGEVIGPAVRFSADLRGETDPPGPRHPR